MASKKLFTNIKSVMSLKAAAKKAGRKINESDLSFINSAAIVVDHGKIEWIGRESSLPKKYKTIQKIDLKGQYVFPSFIECHTHSVFAGQRSDEFEMRLRGRSYQEIGKKGGGILSTVRATRKASKSQLQELLAERMEKFIRQGVSLVEIKSGYGLNRKTEEKMLEVASSYKKIKTLPTYLGPHAFPEKSDRKKYFASVVSDLKRVKENGLATRCDIFIEKNYFSLQQGREYCELAKDLGFDITIHADQLSRTGASRLAIEMGALSADHVIELSTADKQRLAQSEVTAVLLPAADFYLDCAYPDAEELSALGGRVALATDFNPGSSPTQDLAFVGLLARKKMKMSLAEVWVAYTLNAAYALGVQESQGSLEIGKEANFFVSGNDWTHFFYEVGYTPVRQSFYKARSIFKT